MDKPIKKAAIPSKKPVNKPSAPSMSMEQALAALIQRNEELTSLSKSKDEFIAITSHQLRTPATGVKQYIGLLLEGYAEPLTKNQRLFLEKAYENNERQLHIVDDILRIAQLDLDKIKLHLIPTYLNKLAEDSLSSLETRFHLHNQKAKLIKSPQNPQIVADPEQLRMAIENILENASNYSNERSTVTVKVTTSKYKTARITVKDEGVGINKNDFSKLFQKFSRINNPLTNFVNGTGLGLYFSKKIIELHGGKIKVLSTEGKGTTFIITLPLTRN
jgi:signal transduction histidine kinase